MKSIKTYFVFESGKITEIGKYQPEVSANAAATERMKFFLRHFIRTNKLSGMITIESKAGKFYLGYDVKPKKYLRLLKTELNKRFYIIESI